MGCMGPRRGGASYRAPFPRSYRILMAATLPEVMSMTIDEVIQQNRDRQVESTATEQGIQRGAEGGCPLRTDHPTLVTPQPQNHGTNVPKKEVPVPQNKNAQMEKDTQRETDIRRARKCLEECIWRKNAAGLSTITKMRRMHMENWKNLQFAWKELSKEDCILPKYRRYKLAQDERALVVALSNFETLEMHYLERTREELNRAVAKVTAGNHNH